jgi:hypothetical protein
MRFSCYYCFQKSMNHSVRFGHCMLLRFTRLSSHGRGSFHRECRPGAPPPPPPPPPLPHLPPPGTFSLKLAIPPSTMRSYHSNSNDTGESTIEAEPHAAWSEILSCAHGDSRRCAVVRLAYHDDVAIATAREAIENVSVLIS